MLSVKIVFDVEQAGCESCADRVRGALALLGAVEAVEIDEGADLARVVLASSVNPDQSVVDEALAESSAGAGHLYRVRPGSWRKLESRLMTTDKRF
jgi:copper chaperone CopZ